MSTRPEGQGWWQASDGLWYPPHLHPDAIVGQAAGQQPWSYASNPSHGWYPPYSSGPPVLPATPPRMSRLFVAAIVAGMLVLLCGATVAAVADSHHTQAAPTSGFVNPVPNSHGASLLTPAIMSSVVGELWPARPWSAQSS